MRKERKKFGILYLVIALALILLGFLSGDEAGTFYSGFGTGLLAACIAKFVRQRRLAKNPEKLADYEASLSDERTLYIANKARSTTFFVAVYGELAAGLAALFFLSAPLVGKVLCFAACAQCLLLTVFYFYYNKKY